MLNAEEAAATRKQNQHRIRELVRVSFSIGVNVTTPSRLKDSLKLLNVFLVISSAVALYGHWSLFVRYFADIRKTSESISTALQTIISIVKMTYYLFMQRRFYSLLDMAKSHTLLQKIELFEKDDFPIHEQFKRETKHIMDNVWNHSRRQLIFYLVCCIGILSNYFFGALFVNLYHYYKGTPNYEHRLPFPSYYPIWADKGMSFPYYHIQMYLSGAAVHISAICAVSFDGIFIVLTQHGVGLFGVLRLMIKLSTSPLIPKEKRVLFLRHCIMHYQRIEEFILELNQLYKHISISQFTLSLVTMGIVLFQTSIGLESDVFTVIRMIMYMSAGGTEIVIYCYNAQSLTTASEELPLAFYSCEWYNENAEFKQLLRMMIMRTNRSFSMDISWFTTMCLPTLMLMAKTSGSYFLLLRNLAE